MPDLVLIREQARDTLVRTARYILVIPAMRSPTIGALLTSRLRYSSAPPAAAATSSRCCGCRCCSRSRGILAPSPQRRRLCLQPLSTSAPPVSIGTRTLSPPSRRSACGRPHRTAAPAWPSAPTPARARRPPAGKCVSTRPPAVDRPHLPRRAARAAPLRGARRRRGGFYQQELLFVFGSLLLLYCAGAEGMWRLFDLVGVTEMFDEFVLLLGGAAAARPPPRARPRHVRDLSHRRPGRAAALGVLAFLPPRARPRHVRDLSHRRPGRAAALGVPRAAGGPRDGDRDGAAAAALVGAAVRQARGAPAARPAAACREEAQRVARAGRPAEAADGVLDVRLLAARRGGVEQQLGPVRPRRVRGRERHAGATTRRPPPTSPTTRPRPAHRLPRTGPRAALWPCVGRRARLPRRPRPVQAAARGAFLSATQRLHGSSQLTSAVCRKARLSTAQLGRRLKKLSASNEALSARAVRQERKLRGARSALASCVGCSGDVVPEFDLGGCWPLWEQFAPDERRFQCSRTWTTDPAYRDPAVRPGYREKPPVLHTPMVCGRTRGRRRGGQGLFTPSKCAQACWRTCWTPTGLVAANEMRHRTHVSCTVPPRGSCHAPPAPSLSRRLAGGRHGPLHRAVPRCRPAAARMAGGVGP